MEDVDERNFVKEVYLSSNEVTSGLLSGIGFWIRCHSGTDQANAGYWECLYSSNTWNMDGQQTGYWGKMIIVSSSFLNREAVR